MKGVHLDIQVECECGSFVTQETPEARIETKALVEVKYLCSGCGAGFIVHIQEVKKLLQKAK